MGTDNKRDIVVQKALVPRDSPTLRLAHVPGAQGDNNLLGRNGVEKIPDSSRPGLLISYVYLTAFEGYRSRYAYRDWMMDSGAFSAYNSGAVIDLDAYIKDCYRLLAEDPTLVEIIALDVIGDGRGSLVNADKMREAGLDVIPVFHIGDDWGILKEYCRNHRKVGLSCRFGESVKESYKFYDECFALAWPKKFHSFGWTAEQMLMRYPFHSSDSTSWEMGPCAFGRWKTFGKMSVRGSSQNLRVEIEWHLELEEKLRSKWKREMARLEEEDKSFVLPNTIRLACRPGSGRWVTEASTGENK